jgi:hypothetical protein
MYSRGVRLSSGFVVSVIIVMNVSSYSSRNDTNAVNAQVAVVYLQSSPVKSDTGNFWVLVNNTYKTDNGNCTVCVNMSKSKQWIANTKESSEPNPASAAQPVLNNNEKQSEKFKKFGNFTQIQHGTRLGFDNTSSNAITKNQTSIKNNNTSTDTEFKP